MGHVLFVMMLEIPVGNLQRWDFEGEEDEKQENIEVDGVGASSLCNREERWKIRIVLWSKAPKW